MSETELEHHFEASDGTMIKLETEDRSLTISFDEPVSGVRFSQAAAIQFAEQILAIVG